MIGDRHRVQGVPVVVERDPDDGQLFPVCLICNLALSIHDAKELEACKFAAEEESCEH